MRQSEKELLQRLGPEAYTAFQIQSIDRMVGEIERELWAHAHFRPELDRLAGLRLQHVALQEWGAITVKMHTTDKVRHQP